MFLKNVFTVAVLSGAVVTLLVWLGLPPGHSAPFNFGWLTQYTDALSWAHPVPRFLPGLWAGFGGYDFFFYAPLPFWLGSAVIYPLCAGCAASTGFVLAGSVMLVISGLTMWQFLRCFFADRPAAFGAVIYVILPYHLLIDWFERQAVGEFTAYAFIPLIALGTERIRLRAAGGWLLAVGVAGTALSHLPTALLAGHVFALLWLCFAVLERGELAAKLRLLVRFAWFGGLGLALAGFYWLPALVLLDSVSPAVLSDAHFEAWRWLFGHPSATPNPAFAPRILASFLACAPFLIMALRFARGAVLVWIVVPALFALVMNTTPSEMIWRESIIARVQFPWRLMTLMDFATGIAAAALAASAGQRHGRMMLLVAVMLASLPAAFLAATLSYTQAQAKAAQTYRDWFAAVEYVSPEMAETLRNRLGQPEIGHFDQFAIAATVAEMAEDFQGAEGVGEVVARGPRSVTVLADPEAAVVSVPVQYWVFWRAETASDRAIETRANPAFGTIDLVAPEGGFQGEPVVVWLPFHPSEVLGGALSLLALLLLRASSVVMRRYRW